MKPSEIRAMSFDDIEKRLDECRNELLRLNLRRRMGSVEKTHQFCSLRREVARISTIRREMKVASGGIVS